MVTAAAKAKANDLDRQREALEARGVAASKSIGGSVSRAAALAFRNGEDVSAAIRASFSERFEAIIFDGMLASHLRGRFTLIQSAAAASGSRVELAVTSVGSPFGGAVSFLQKRMDLSDQQLGELTEKYGAEALRITRNTSDVVERQAQAALLASAQTGETVRQGEARLRDAIGDSGITTNQPHLFETLWRTQMQMAFSAGRFNAAQDPAIDEILWGYEYVTVGDNRVRPTHAALEGLRAPKRDPIWDTITPPNGFNCRCTLLEIFKDEKSRATATQLQETVEVDGVEVTPGADVGFGFNPARLFSDALPVKTTPLTQPPALPTPRRRAKRKAKTKIRKLTEAQKTAALRKKLEESRKLTAAVDQRLAEAQVKVESAKAALDSFLAEHGDEIAEGERTREEIARLEKATAKAKKKAETAFDDEIKRIERGEE